MKSIVKLAALSFLTVFLTKTIATEAAPRNVDSSLIYVSDVVEDCIGEACKIAVGSAPLPGFSRIVHKSEVLNALRESGVDATSLSIPEQKQIVRPKATVSSREIKNRVWEAIESVIPKDTVLVSIGEVGKINTPKSGFEIRASWPGESEYKHRVSIPITFIADNVTFRTIQVFAELSLEARVPVAALNLMQGSILNEDSFSWSIIRTKQSLNGVARLPEELIGNRLVKPILRGEPFALRNIERVFVVKQGQKLIIESKVGQVSIRATGTARQDGAIGDRIRASIEPWNRLLWVEVTGTSSAVVTQ